ncbi:N-alpha-acetyltransferase 60 [Rhynchospora pubera]|uniref:N-alpha-acetyltransferase 60 n=1 Tax=Rhynchospora pubera TaxID=906938 RepID=A0AAV8CWL8_9POAL|nr:N-alpha-acetyltransferase 60 [Rhynchospora pubera]
MLDSSSNYSPTIVYRPIRPSDLDVLEQIHIALFPIRYEREFFLDVVHGRGIISWGAVDINRPDGRDDELIGFVTTRINAGKDSEIEDLFRYNASRNDLCLLYILTLGVVEDYRCLGIASSLVQEVIKYASSIASCRGVYLHVISYNQPAINFYKKMLFRLVRRLSHFYYIRGRHYDSYLFVYYVNGGRSPCSPLEIVTAFLVHFRGFLRMLISKLQRTESNKNLPRWYRCKEANSLMVNQNKRIISADDTTCQHV